MGIPTNSFTDAEIIYFCIHLSTCVSLTISSGFVQIIEEIEGDTNTSEEDRENNLIDTQEEEQNGHPLSCEDLDSSAFEEYDFWPQEVLYAPTKDTGRQFHENTSEEGEMRGA